MIEDYYRVINILSQTKVDKGTTTISQYNTIDSCMGVINQNAQVKVPIGKSIERSAYKALTEINTNITDKVRLQDSLDNKIYRVKGNPKDTMNMNHHYRIELEYFTEDN